MRFLIEGIISGILIGGVYSLVALGIVVIYKSTKIISFAQGGIVLMGAIIGWYLMGPLGLTVIPGILLTLVACLMLGMGIDRFCMRPIIGQPILASIMVTIALAWLFDSIGILIIGGGERPYPEIFPTETFEIGFLSISQSLLIQFVIAAILFVCFYLFYKRTQLGLAMRGTAEDYEVVQSLGIKVTRIFSFSWIFAGFFGGASGILLASSLGATVGLSAVGLTAIVVVLIGGMESITGVIIMGPVIGILETLTVQYLDPMIGGGLGEVVPYIIMLIVLVFKPYGLFGLERIERI